jgi:hypothetical protein
MESKPGGDNKTTSIYEKLCAVQQLMNVGKTEKGRFGAHRTAEGIIEHAKPLLAKQGLTLLLDSSVISIEGTKYVKVDASVIDANGNKVTVSAQAWEGEISRGLDAPQVTGSATSYARKYALGGLFAVADGKDDPDQYADPAPTPQRPKLATGPQKFQLQKLMKEKGIDEADQMIMFIESVISKKRVETQEDYNNVKAALEDEAGNE